MGIGQINSYQMTTPGRQPLRKWGDRLQVPEPDGTRRQPEPPGLLELRLGPHPSDNPPKSREQRGTL